MKLCAIVLHGKKHCVEKVFLTEVCVCVFSFLTSKYSSLYQGLRIPREIKTP